jgi:hypothetical protein
MRWILVAILTLFSLPAAAQQCGPANLGQQACMGGSVCRCQQMPSGLMLREPGGFRWNCDLLIGACSGSWSSAIPALSLATVDTDQRPIGPADVRRAQQALASLGFDPGPVDGVVGPRTRTAITAYERQAGLPQTGRITRALLQRLL